LPAARRTAALSIPWSTALRIMCVSGSPIFSITPLSISVVSPVVSSLMSLPVSADRSRSIRGTRLNAWRIGCARSDITVSWISRVSR